MLRRVWIEGWQMQCCGEPFRIGQHVEFSTTPTTDRAFLSVIAGEDRAASITDREDHHDLNIGPMTPLSGRVERIEAVSCWYEQSDRMLTPVAGTTFVTLKDDATGWEPEDDGPGLHFMGYVVTVLTN